MLAHPGGTQSRPSAGPDSGGSRTKAAHVSSRSDGSGDHSGTQKVAYLGVER